jgi:hypothetical protein
MSEPSESPIKCSPKIRVLDIFLGELELFIWIGGHICLRVVNVTWTELEPLAFILHLCNQFWIVARFVCSFSEAMAVSLSVASTAISSAKVAVVESGEVGRSAVYSRYNMYFIASIHTPPNL